MKKLIAQYILTLKNESENTTQAKNRSIYAEYIAHIAPLLASLVENDKAINIKEMVNSHERLLGHTWIEGEHEHDRIYSKWKKVKDKLKI